MNHLASASQSRTVLFDAATLHAVIQSTPENRGLAVQPQVRYDRSFKELERQTMLRAAKSTPSIAFGQWLTQFDPVEIDRVEPSMSKNQLWTHVDGPRYNGDIDVIIPGYWPEIGIRYFYSDESYTGARLAVSLM